MASSSPLRRRTAAVEWRRSPVYRAMRRPLIYWSAVGLLVTLTIVTAAQSADRRSQLEDHYGALRPVPVAIAEIRPGEPLDSGSVEWQQRPGAGVPSGAVMDLADGAVASAAVYPGEVIHSARVAGGGSGFSSRLAPGTAAVSVPTPYGYPPVEPGDRVRLVAVIDDFASSGAPEAHTVAQWAMVLETAEDSVTVAVDTAELSATVSALIWGTIAIAALGAPTG